MSRAASLALSRSRSPAGERSRARALLSRLGALALAAIVLASLLTAGRTYLFCSMMDRVVDACCCAPETDGEDTHDGPALKVGCCEDRVHGDIAQGNLAAGDVEVPVALPASAVLPAVIVAQVLRAPALLDTERPAVLPASPIRAGPRTASEACVYLQVFRC
ncbi:MAG: hypothetical protein U0359_14850 [Byssovorax sp.]